MVYNMLDNDPQKRPSAIELLNSEECQKRITFCPTKIITELNN